MRFSDIVTEYVVKTEKDKVRHNSFDDFGLGYGWVFIGGWYDEASVWRTAWGKLSLEISSMLPRHMCDGPATSLHFYVGGSTLCRCSATDKTTIPNIQIGEVSDIPADLEHIVKNY